MKRTIIAAVMAASSLGTPTMAQELTSNPSRLEVTRSGTPKDMRYCAFIVEAEQALVGPFKLRKGETLDDIPYEPGIRAECGPEVRSLYRQIRGAEMQTLLRNRPFGPLGFPRLPRTLPPSLPGK